jgi:hypothetical protein
MHALTALLWLMQPIARLRGRFKHGLTPWRRRGVTAMRFPRPRESTHWSENWVDVQERLRAIRSDLVASGALVLNGGNYDRWDLQIQAGVLGAVRVRMAIEEHGAGRQLVRIRSWPHPARTGVGLAVLFGVLTVITAAQGPLLATIVIGTLGLLLAGGTLAACAAASDTACRVHAGLPWRRRSRGRGHGLA